MIRRDKYNLNREYRNILHEGSLLNIKFFVHLMNLPQDDIYCNAMYNNSVDVKFYIYDYLKSKGYNYNEICFKYTRGDINIIEKLVDDGVQLSDQIAGEAIYDCLNYKSKNLKELIEYFKSLNINVSNAIKSYRDYQEMTSIDLSCFEPYPDLLPILISNTTDDDLREILTTRNYGGRYTFGHCTRYNYIECINIIENELKRLNLSKKGDHRQLTITKIYPGSGQITYPY